MADATDLHELALDYLDACVQALDTIPLPLVGAPVRAFVAPGVPAFDFATDAQSEADCDQLTVHVGPIAERFGVLAGAINDVTLIATIVRCCLPTVDNRGNAPSASAQQDSAAQINADKWALWNYLHALHLGGQLFDQCCSVAWGSLTPIPPSGGCGGSVLPVTVCFDGYEIVLGT